jgi:putative hemolysin
MPVTTFNDIMGLALPEEESDTVGGFVFSLFGEMPREGAVVAYGNLTFKVMKTKGTRILELEVRQEIS